MFSGLCTVVADTRRVARSLSSRRGRTGRQFYSQEFSIVLLFGLTELKAQLSWMEEVRDLLICCPRHVLITF